MQATDVTTIPLSKSKVQVLRLLGHRGGQTSTHVARFLGVSKPAVTQIVDALVRHKLVARKTAKQDRRGVDLSLTPKGKLLLKRVIERQRQSVQGAMKKASRAHAEQMVKAMQDLAGDLARADKDFQHFCLQCGAHPDGTCILTGGIADCLFLEQEEDMALIRRRRPARRVRARR
jgi:DNA-binding MarR family transcriptional regulator